VAPEAVLLEEWPDGFAEAGFNGLPRSARLDRSILGGGPKADDSQRKTARNRQQPRPPHVPQPSARSTEVRSDSTKVRLTRLGEAIKRGCARRSPASLPTRISACDADPQTPPELEYERTSPRSSSVLSPKRGTSIPIQWSIETYRLQSGVLAGEARCWPALMR